MKENIIELKKTVSSPNGAAQASISIAPGQTPDVYITKTAPGVAFVLVGDCVLRGSRIADKVIVASAGFHDLRRMAGGTDEIKLPGAFADYDKTVSADGSAITLKSAANTVLVSTSSDCIFFADGAVNTSALKDWLLAGATGQPPLMQQPFTHDPAQLVLIHTQVAQID